MHYIKIRVWRVVWGGFPDQQFAVQVWGSMERLKISPSLIGNLWTPFGKNLIGTVLVSCSRKLRGGQLLATESSLLMTWQQIQHGCKVMQILLATSRALIEDSRVLKEGAGGGGLKM